MAENDVQITIDVNAKDAQQSLKEFGKTAQDIVGKAEAGFSSMASGMGKFALAAAGAVASFAAIKKAVSEAVEEENGVRQLNLALAGTGEFSAEASKSMLAFADSLGDVTGLGDDAIRTSLTLAKSFGVTNEQAQELVRAATNLSAVTGQDLDLTVRQLGQTLDGSVGKLGNLGAEFRNLTEEQAKNLGVIDLINSKYGEAGEALGQTFSANLARLSKAFDDSFKAIGTEIINDNQIKQLITSFATALKVIAPVLSDITKLALKLFGTIVEGLGYVVTGAAIAGEALGEALGLESLTEKSRELQTTFLNMSESIRKASEESSDANIKTQEFDKTLIKVSESAKKAKQSFNGLGKDAIKLAEEGRKFTDSILAGFGQQGDVEAQKAAQAIKSVEEQLEKGTISFQTAYDLKLRIAEDFNAKVEKRNEDSLKKQADDALKSAADARARIEQAASQPIKFVIDQKGALNSKEIGASVVGGIGLALKGKAGAIDAVSQTFAGIGDAILPGIGGAVGGLAQLLAQGPEATKKFIKEFIRSIPDIIEAIAESIPVVVEVLVDTLVNRGGAARIGIAIGKAMIGQAVFARIGEQVFGKSGDELAKVIQSGATQYAKDTQDIFSQAAEDFGPSVASGLQGLGETLLESFQGFDDLFSNALDGFVENLGSEFGYFFSNLGQSLLNFISAFPIALVSGVAEAIGDIFAVFDPLISALRSLQSAVEKAGSIGGSGGGQGLIAEGAAKLGKALGLAQGGIVPLYAASGAFVPKGTDTVPAMLTPGELVVPRDMVGELSNFLARQSSTNGSDPAMLAAILTAVQAPMVVKAEAKVNQNAFADIILQLNRQNARLSA